MKYPKITVEKLNNRLSPPKGRVRMVLDTDTYNEIDDQFAVVYALLSQEKLDVEALYAAPFLNERSTSPADGMEQSYAEILRLLDRMGRDHAGFVYRGSEAFLQNRESPVQSEAALDLIERALKTEGDPLYVVAIGAITNVASAILMAPEIIEKIVVVWLGGHAFHWPDTKEFNLWQDPESGRVIFDSGVPVVHLPCMGVVTHLHTTMAEIDKFVAGRGKIGDYLAETFREADPHHFAYSRVLWDMATIAYLLNDHWTPSKLAPSPHITPEGAWQIDPNRHSIRSAYYVNRDEVFRDFFSKIEKWSLNED